MPRVHTRTKAARGKPYTCSTCGEEIKPGETFYYWQFRYGGTRRRHQEHGYPRQSMLTQSLMGEVYGAIENVEDVIGADDWTLDDATQAVEDLKNTAEEVKQQYEDAAEPFGGAGPNMERAEELESYIDELEGLDLSEWEDKANNEGEPEECETCNGKGTADCQNCDGSGKVTSGLLVKSTVVIAGVPTEVEEEEMVDCDVCEGTGGVKCEECDGSGESDEEPTDWRDEAKSAIEEGIGGAP